MEPTRNTQATLVDLLDRILEKGLVINADIIVSVAGIPLIGVKLRAALAGMDTMLKYGIMQDWDKQIRANEGSSRVKKEVSLLQGEELKLKILGAFYHTEGIYVSWRTGHIYITDKRVFLRHQEFDKVMFEASLEEIKGFSVSKNILGLVLHNGKTVRLRTPEIDELNDSLTESLKLKGLAFEENIAVAEIEDDVPDFLMEGERITHCGKAWHTVSTDIPEKNILSGIWKPGHLYITNKRLCWWYDFEKKLMFEIPTKKIVGSVIEIRNLNPLLKKKKVFDVIYESDSQKRVASFSGKEAMYEWERAIARIISFRERIEPCPKCGKMSVVLELLEDGCANCGWISPRIKKKPAAIA